MRKFTLTSMLSMICVIVLLAALTVSSAMAWPLQVSTATIDNVTTKTNTSVVTLHKYTRAVTVAIPAVTSTYFTAKVSMDNSTYYTVYNGPDSTQSSGVSTIWKTPTGTGGITLELPQGAAMHKYIYFVANDNQSTAAALKVLQWGAQ